MLLALASVTDSLVTFATHVIRDLGLGGVALLTFTSAVIAVPGTEATMLFAGFDVFSGHLSLPGIIVAGVVGDVVGGSVAYAIGYYGGIELIDRHGTKLHISRRRLERAQGWFDRYGAPVIFVSRLIPVVRAAFPWAAGVSQVRYSRFLVFATLGSIVWIGGLGVLGRAVGSDWESWRRHLEIVDYLGLAIVVAAIAYLILRRVRAGRERAAADVAS